MNDSRATIIIKAYEIIEKNLIHFLDLIPPEGCNRQTWSPKLVSILLDTGSLVDSIFRDAAPNKDKRTTGRIVKRKDMNMNDFRRIYSKKFSIDVRSLMLISPPIVLQPFKDFNKKSPDWWKIYNKVKHDRLGKASLVTIDIAMDAVCGLFQLIAQYPIMYRYLVRYRWAGYGNYNLDLIMPLMSSEHRVQKMSQSAIHETFLVSTKLFITTIGPRVFPENSEEIRPMDYYPPRKLMTFLGRGYG
ncbi:MAG: hypothetical protein ACKKMV_02970 [Candidatus Nealsonbacteria bacterium]